MDLSFLETYFQDGGNEIQFLNNDVERLSFGNIWFGDYLHLPENGHFGSEQKQKHWGVITDKRQKKKGTRLISPITSKVGNKKVYTLRAGLLNSKQKVESYILLDRWAKLRVRNETLKENFKYEGQIPDVYISELKEMTNE